MCDARGDTASHIKIPCVLFELMETDFFQRISGHSAEKLPMSISLHILTEISQGLKFLHEKDFVHKNLLAVFLSMIKIMSRLVVFPSFSWILIKQAVTSKHSWLQKCFQAVSMANQLICILMLV